MTERLRIDVLTLFTEVFEAPLRTSILGIAADKGLVSYHAHNIRDYAAGAHKSVDDRPYGGGPGMVMMPQPVFDCVEDVESKDRRKALRVMLTPQGERFDHRAAQAFSRAPRLMLLCGHYEGFDERIRGGLDMREVSIGDYVLGGGEFAALVVIDAVVRLIPGALGHEDSPKEESFAGGMLEYPQYTRPVEFRGVKVPEVLLSGNHKKIREWRLAKARERTEERRPDLLAGADNGQ